MAEEKTTQPRLYKRGNDDINLDEYIRNAEAEFDFWLANSRLKDKQKKEVRNVYSQLLQGINDGTVTYKIGGGYDNSIGINNAPKGFDAAGLAAGFLGNILRAQNVYTAPQIESPVQEIVQPVTVVEPEEHEDIQPQITRTYANETEYLDTEHPRSTQTLNPPRIIRSNKQNYSQADRQQLVTTFASFSDIDLLNLIKKCLSIPLNATSQFKGFNNNYILSTSLEIARRKGLLKQFSDMDNRYYIPLESDTLNTRSTGIVYQISQDGNHRILEMDRRDIPFFTNQWHSDFTTYIPSNKNGGQLRKFAIGGVSNVKYNTDNYSWDDIIYRSDQFANVLRGLNLQNYEDANALQNSYYTDKINDKWNEGTLGKRDVVSQYQTDFNTAYGTYLNQGAIEDAIKAGKITRVGTTGDNLAGNYTDGYSGAMTNLRHLGTNEHVGYIKEMNKILNPNGLEAFLNEDTNMINYRPLENPAAIARKAVVVSTQSPEAKTPEQLSKEQDTVEEYQIPEGTEGIRSPKWYESALDAINPGRLWMSLRANQRVYNTILPSLKPVLKDTYERYSPIKGAFSTMQLKNRQAADILSQSYRPFTTDASLAVARMLEGQIRANQAQAEGFLADDQEVRRTGAEALARQEDNMARRSEVANFNRASINQTNRERAQLAATRIKSNWASRDNFLKEFESRLRTKVDENRILTNQFRVQMATDAANRWYSQQMEAADRERDTWLRDNTKDGVTPDIIRWEKWTKYDKRRRLAEHMSKAMLNKELARIYGMGYDSLYTDDAYKNFIKWN